MVSWTISVITGHFMECRTDEGQNRANHMETIHMSSLVHLHYCSATQREAKMSLNSL